MFDFIFLGNITADEIISCVNTFSEEQWTKNNIRNEKNRVHINTNSIDILWHPNSLITGEIGKKNHENFNQIKFDKIEKQLLPLYRKKYGKGKIIRALLARLKPKSNIMPHHDFGKSLIECNRTHIPLVTNENILFTVGNTTKKLKVGEVWEINNEKTHSVKNNSNEHRIHLIVDYLQDIYEFGDYVESGYHIEDEMQDREHRDATTI